MPASRIKFWTSPRVLVRTILGIEDSTHSIALGTAIGMAIGLTPTVGIQMVLVILLALVSRPFFHFNRLAALLTVYVSNPITTVPIYYALYRVGSVFVQGDVASADFERVVSFEEFDGWWEAIRNLFVEIGTPLLIGTLIVAPICGLMTYPVMRWLLHSVRRANGTAPISTG
jgi:uncharacterized protein (DUF2062 family)